LSQEQDKFFDDLYHASHPTLATYALSQLKDLGQAEELVQDTFYTALRKYETLRRHKDPEAFLMNILKYKIMEYRRKQQQYLRLFLSLDSGLQCVADASGDFTPISMDSLIEQIQSVLTPKEWYLLQRRVFGGATHLDLAKELGVSVWASQKRLERIHKKLKNALPDVFALILK